MPLPNSESLSDYNDTTEIASVSLSCQRQKCLPRGESDKITRAAVTMQQLGTLAASVSRPARDANIHTTEKQFRSSPNEDMKIGLSSAPEERSLNVSLTESSKLSLTPKADEIHLGESESQTLTSNSCTMKFSDASTTFPKRRAKRRGNGRIRNPVSSKECCSPTGLNSTTKKEIDARVTRNMDKTGQHEMTASSCDVGNITGETTSRLSEDMPVSPDGESESPTAIKSMTPIPNYESLVQLVPSLCKDRKNSKTHIVTETAKYIDSLRRRVDHKFPFPTDKEKVEDFIKQRMAKHQPSSHGKHDSY